MRKILAADDDEGIRAFYTMCLSDAGFEVETVEDATAAVIKCLESKPDLLILDAEMGGGGGEQVFKMIREVLEKGVPVIFITGMPDLVRPLAVHKNVLVLQKPVGPAALVDEVNRMLTESGA